MAGRCFSSCDLTGFHTSLHDLHARVADGCGRVEIVGAAPDHVCVLISKTELECLEKALHILSGTEAFKDMCSEVQQAAVESGVVPVSCGDTDGAFVP